MIVYYSHADAEFEWDSAKAIDNAIKHGVTFVEAASACGDRLAATFNDPMHSDAEDRFLTFGVSEQQRLLVVTNCDRDGRTRIISARRALRKERTFYEEGD